MKEPDLSKWNVEVLREKSVLSDSGGPVAEELQPVMF